MYGESGNDTSMVVTAKITSRAEPGTTNHDLWRRHSDYIRGGAGSDTVHGGAGNDKFPEVLAPTSFSEMKGADTFLIGHGDLIMEDVNGQPKLPLLIPSWILMVRQAIELMWRSPATGRSLTPVRILTSSTQRLPKGRVVVLKGVHAADFHSDWLI